MAARSILVLALLVASASYALAGKKISESNYDDIPTYVVDAPTPLPVQIDVSSQLLLPWKKEKIQGKEATKVGTRVTATAIGIAPDATNEVRVRANADTRTKWAPSKAYATAYGENGGIGNVFVLARSRAFQKPGLPWTVSSANSDAVAKAGGTTPLNSGIATILSSSRATGGTGITFSNAKGYAESTNQAYVNLDSRANSAKWYASPGFAMAGGSAVARGGHVGIYTDIRPRVDKGIALGGILSVAKSNGVQPVFFQLLPTSQGGDVNGDGWNNIIYMQANNDPRVDVGLGAGGIINVGTTAAGKVVLLTDNLESSIAVGDAAAGLLNVAVSNDGNVLIGDYDNSDATQNELIARTRGRGEAQGGMVNIALAPNGDGEVTGNVVVAADQGNAYGGALSLANAWGRASNDMSVTVSTSEYGAIAGLTGLSQAQEQAQNTLASSARSNIGPALSWTEGNSVIGEIAVATGSSSATTVTGQSASTANSQALAGITAESQAASTATTKDGHAASAGSAISFGSFTAEAVSTSSGTTTNGAALSASGALAVGGDSEADSASSAASAVGNVGSASGALSIGLVQGKANSASSAASETGSVGSISMAGSTGAIQAQAKVSSSAQTADGNAQSLAGALSVSGINSVSSAKSTAASQTGDVDATAESYGLGAFHGEANADAAAATGCADCDSTATAIGIATGMISDATARAKADSPKNPGQALANAMALGAVSRTSNGGQARVAIGPAQALTGGFAVSAPRSVVAEVNKAAAMAMDPTKKAKAQDTAAAKAAVSKALGSMLPKPAPKAA